MQFQGRRDESLAWVVSRRELLRVGALLGLGALAAACQPETGAKPALTAAPSFKLRDDLRIVLAALGNEALDPIKGPSNNIRYLSYLYDPLVGTNFTAS